MKFEIEFYETEFGKEPAKEFILSLDKKMRARVFKMLDILEEFGNDLREPYSKSLGNKIFELRIKYASDISRILYFFYAGKKIILTNGFVKKTQKTPISEIEKAEKYRKDYLRRNGE